MGFAPIFLSTLWLKISINDSERRVKFYLDAEFEDGMMGVHPNDNTATVYMKADDVLRLIREHGNQAETAEI